MARRKYGSPSVSDPSVPQADVGVEVAREETEEEMISRIKAGNGSDDEYVDKYHKDFPY